jgi:hypothetical protein
MALTFQLQAFGLIVVFDDLAYALDNCALDTATIDFGIDAEDLSTLQMRKIEDKR